jgi:hypothetical protein
MSCRSLLVISGILSAIASPAVAAPPKTYKKPATVPTARIIATTQGAVGLAIPSSEDIDRATGLVRKTFADEYKPAAVAKRKEFARELLRQGLDTRDDPAARYVLLDDAANIAAAAGDAATAARAVDELAKSYQVDPVEMKVLKLAETAKCAFTRESIDGLVAACLTAAEVAVTEERYEPAGRLIGIAESATERGKQVNLKVTVSERKRELEALRAGAGEYALAREALEKKSGDAESSLTAGRFLCLVKGEWDKGLPLLAAGNDERLKSLAIKDIENPADPGAKAQAGRGWWELSARLSGVMRSQARRRAIHWYRLAMPGLSGVNRKAVDDHLKEVQADRLRELNLSPGLVAELFDGQKGERKKLTRIDPVIDFDWQDKPAADGVAKDNFSVSWSGHLNVLQSGQYTFVIIANDGAAIDIAGVNVFDKGELGRKRNGERFVVRLDEGIHPFKLRFWDATGIAKVRLLWVRPGASSEEVVPRDAFCHEGGAAAPTSIASPAASAR